jgi:hypothetical protein
MSDPWAFGWTQLLTAIGFIITISIAIGGFKSFNRWKREKLEDKKIDVAFEALALAYEAKYVFAYLQPPAGFSGGAHPVRDDWRKRVEESHDFFDRIWKIQPKCMAFFGPEVEEIFSILHEALMRFQSAQTFRDSHPERERVAHAEGGSANRRPTIYDDIEEFRKRLEDICRPIIDRQYRSVEFPARKTKRRGSDFRVVGLQGPPPSTTRGTTKAP